MQKYTELFLLKGLLKLLLVYWIILDHYSKSAALAMLITITRSLTLLEPYKKSFIPSKHSHKVLFLSLLLFSSAFIEDKRADSG